MTYPTTNYNIDVTQDSNFTIEVNLSGPNLDLSLGNAWMDVKRSVDAPDPLITYTLNSGLSFDDQTNTLTIQIAPHDTNTIKFGGEELGLVYDLQYEQSGSKYTVMIGEFNILKNITTQDN